MTTTAPSLLCSSSSSIPGSPKASAIPGSPKANAIPNFVPISKFSRTASFRLAAAATCTPPVSLYDVLDLPAGATPPEIKAAYRKLVRSYHPDVVAVERKETSTELFMRVHAAYTTLSDPDKRAEYDRQLLLRRGRRAAPSSYAGLRRRTWETDQCW